MDLSQRQRSAAIKALHRDARAAVAALDTAEREAAAPAARARNAIAKIEILGRELDALENINGADEKTRAMRADLAAQLADFRAAEHAGQQQLARLAKARQDLEQTVAELKSSGD
jgi:chromosome segregation ATPase